MPSGGNNGINQNWGLKLFSITPNQTYFNENTLFCAISSIYQVMFYSNLNTKTSTSIPIDTLLFTLPSELTPKYIHSLSLCISNPTTTTYSIIPISIGTNGYVRNRAAITTPANQTIRLQFDGLTFNNLSKYYR